MVIEGEDWKMQSLYQHSERCYIFGIVVKEEEITEIDQQEGEIATVEDQREIWYWSNNRIWSKGLEGEIVETNQSKGEIEDQTYKGKEERK